MDERDSKSYTQRIPWQRWRLSGFSGLTWGVGVHRSGEAAGAWPFCWQSEPVCPERQIREGRGRGVGAGTPSWLVIVALSLTPWEKEVRGENNDSVKRDR